MPLKDLRWIRSYPLAILTVLLALQAIWVIQPYISTTPPFITFLAAIMVTAWYGGVRPALFATLLSGVLIDYYLIAPFQSFHTTPADLGSLAFFGLVATTMTYAIAHLQKARLEAVATQQRLEHLHELSGRLLNEEGFEHMLQNVLTAVLDLLGTHKGVIQLYEPEHRTLALATQVGFNQEECSRHFHQVPLDVSHCGAVFHRKERIVIEHIATDPACAHLASLLALSDVVSAHSMPLFRADHSVFGVLTTYHSRPSIDSEENFRLVDLYARQAERILETKDKEERLRRANAELGADLCGLVSELAVTEDKERRQLASELHDYLAQLLVLAQIKLSLAQRSMSQAPGKSEQYIQETTEVLKLSQEYVRTLIAELCPPELYHSGLPAAVQWLAGHMSQQGLTVELHLPSESPALPTDQTVLLYKSIRELLINVMRHAMIDQAKVSMSVDSSKILVIEVQDDGHGFDTSATTRTGADGHFGLAHIRERMTMLGGWCQVDSIIGRGTAITLGLPLDRQSSVDTLRAARAPQQNRVKARSHEVPTQARLPQGPYQTF